MPIDQTPEPLGFRGLGHVPGLVMTPDESAIKPQQGYVTDVPGQDEPIERAPSPSFGQQIADIGTTALGLMSPAATLGRMVGRKIAGGPLIAPQEQRILDLGAASYRQENEVVGAFRSVFSDRDFGDSDPLHNPWDVIAGTTLEPYWQYFVGSRNARETEWLRDRLMQELSDRELLADNPLLGSALAMMASIASPTTLLPGGAIYRGLKGAERVVAGARTAASVGTMGAVGVGAQEWLLHQQQMARTFGESAFAVGGAFLLGGVLGGVISGSASKRIGRLAEALEREIHVPPRSEEDIYGMGGLKTARGVGAQATDAKPPVELEGTGIGMQRWMRFQDPVLRTLNSPIRTAREVGTQLYETVLGVTRNAEGVTTAPVGGAVETRIKTQGQARLGEAMRQTDELFAEYYFGKTDAAFAAVRSEIGRLQGSQKLTAKQFKEEIGRAMARADEHAIPQVAQAAKIWRKVLIDPIADAAIKQKLLDPEVVAKGRPKSGGGSTPPAGGTPAPQGPRGPGPGGTGGNAGPDFPFDIQRMRQIEANVQALQTELGLPPMGEALREAFLQRMSKALEDVTIDPATRALLDVLEGRTPRVEVDQEIAKRLQEALQAQRAASGADVAADVQKAASDALERLNEVLPDEFAPKAMKMLEDAFSGRMPSLDEIVDLFAPKMAKVEMSPISPFRIRQNAIKGEVEAIKEMWRFVATVPNKPPEGLVSWMVRSGGVVDAQGDIAAMLGAKNKRPGLLRTSGPQLDDVALRAWEEGFLPGDVLPDGTVGRPTINQLLDAVRDDLYAGHPAERVIRATDREALDLWVQASEFRRELRDMGITSRMGEASVEKVAERFAAERFDAGLDGPAAAVMAAHANHMLRMMDKFMETGKTYSIGHHVHQKIKETLGDDVKLAADDTVVATAERFVPKGTMRFNGEITPKVEITFRTFDDDLLTVTLPWSQARDLRAAHFPVNSIPGFNGRAIVFFRSTLSNSDSLLRKTLGGELIHELVHNQVSDLGVSHLTRPLWDRLVRHAESLRVLEMDQKQYMAAIAHPSARADAPDVTMRERYEERYSGRANKDQMLREESVAHMLELWRHGQWMKSELEPIADILRAFERNDLKSQSVLDDLLEAERVRAEAEVAAIAAERAATKKASEDMMFAVEARHGSPEDLARSGLDMSPEARKARAEEMGFDTSRVLYHGSTRTFDSFQPQSLGGAGPEVVWLTSSSRVASEYTGLEFGPRNVLDHEKPNITPVYVRGRTLVVEEKLRPVGKRALDVIEKAKLDGYDVVVFKNMDDSLGGSYVLQEQVVVFDPSNIRSVNAAFDPAESASSKLMAALGPSGEKPKPKADDLARRLYERVRAEAEAAAIAAERAAMKTASEDMMLAIDAWHGSPEDLARSGLDVSPEARKARAEKMGFDTSKVYHHTSNSTFDAFDLARGGGALGPSFAKGEAVYQGPHMGQYYLRLRKSLSFNTGFEVTPRELVRHLIDGRYTDFNGDVKPVGLEISPADKAVLAATIEKNGWDADRAQIVRDVLRRHNIDGFEFVHEGMTEAIVFDPSNIRSVNAAFDPAESASSKLMAALGPSGQKPKPKADDLARRLYERVRAEVADELEKPKPKAGEDPPAFDPETAKVIYDDEGQSYISRLYKREKIIAERGQFRDILIEHFAAGQQRAERLLKQITDDIKAGRKAPDAKTETQIEQLREFTGLERKDLHDIAEKVIQHILGEAEGRMTFDLPAAVRGPLKARTLRIRDELIEDFLDRDIERIGRHYVRGMVPDIELTRMFGSVDMKEPIQKIWDEATRLGDANPKNREAIHAQAKAAVRDLLAIRDRMRGTYMLPDDPTAILPRIGSVIRTLNYMRLLGGMTIAAIPDTARVVMTHGIVSTFRDGLVPLLTSLNAVKAAGREVKLAGTALDMILDTRAMGIADVLDDFGRYSKFERGLQKAQEHFGVLSLMAPWNAGMKQWVGMIVMSNIMREGEHLLMGKALSKAAIKRLAASNIDLDMLQIIAEQWKKHGTKTGNVYLPNTIKWDLDKPNVQLALDAFRGAIVRDVDRIVVTPGQDKPLWMSTQIGKIVGQFKSFGVASVQRTLIAGLQQRDAGVVLGFAMAIGLGAVVEALKNKLAGKDNPKTTAQWVVNAIDKSGLTGWLYDINHFSERFTGGTVGLAALTGRPISRFAARNWADAIGGPSAGLLKDLAGSNASLFRWAFNNEKPTEADVRALRRTIPLQNLFYLSWLFRELEEGTAKAIGARPSPKRN